MNEFSILHSIIFGKSSRMLHKQNKIEHQQQKSSNLSKLISLSGIKNPVEWKAKSIQARSIVATLTKC